MDSVMKRLMGNAPGNFWARTALHRVSLIFISVFVSVCLLTDWLLAKVLRTYGRFIILYFPLPFILSFSTNLHDIFENGSRGTRHNRLQDVPI